MTTSRHRWGMLSILVCIVFLMGSVSAQELSPGTPIGSETLYLQAGTVETDRLENLLAAAEPTFISSRVRVLVLDRPMDDALRGRLDFLGVRWLDYLPSNAFTVRLSGVERVALSRVAGVVRVVDYNDSWKLQPRIVERLGTHQQSIRRDLDQMGLLALIVSLHPGEELEQAIVDIRDRGATVELVERVGTHDELSVITTPERLLALSSIESVLFIEDAPDVTLRNSTTRWIIQTNVNNQVPVYDNGIHGEGQVIGVLDGRVDQNHCSFPAGKIVAYNSTAGADSHGTHVAGTAAGNNGVDNDTRGIAYEALLVTNTVPAFTEAGIVGRLDLHHGQGARIHTNSWGNDGTTAYDSLSRGFDVFLRNNEESFVCLAVTNGAVLRNPENAKNLLAVGASQDTPSEANHCSGGVGPTSDGRRKPEVYAPGCSTQSSQSNTACSVVGSTGTSMACPAVSGAAALIRQYFIEGYYPSGAANSPDTLNPSGALIKATLVNSAVDMTGVAGYPSNLEGWGRARIGDPLFFTGDARTLGVLDDVRNASGMNTGQQATYNVNVINSGEVLRITLAWTDVAATAGAGVAPVNDLDLEITSPSGALFLGNVFAGGTSSTGGTRDIINNVEQIHIQTPETGSWTVRIRATAVNTGTQGFAALVTGGVQLAPPDCNDNGVPDDTDISTGTSIDCDGNTVPDECQEDCNLNGVADPCDITAGTSADCDGNSVPDECQPDCNGNGVADSCDISGGVAADCDGNGVPDSCDISGGAVDCDGNGAIDSCDIAGGASDCNLNGSIDSCDIAGGVSSDCNSNGIPDDCDAVSVNTYSSSPAAPIPPDVSDNIVVADAGLILDVDVQVNINHIFVGDLVVDLTSPVGTTVRLQNEQGGSGADIITTFDDDGAGTVPFQPLSAVDGQQKQGTWNLSVIDVFPSADDGVVNSWGVVIEAQGSGFTDCNSNGVDDACDVSSGTTPDCNVNGVPDSCDISAGTSVDANGNGIPDECDSADCNGNGVADDEDIATGTSADCNANAIPDECDIAGGQADCDLDGTLDDCELVSGSGFDCNGNGTLDNCDIASGTAADCNGNTVPDSCDIVAGTVDCDGDGVPDSCELVSGSGLDCNLNGTLDNCDIGSGAIPDCNGNGIPDSCDIATGTPDCNGNSIPDSCDIIAGIVDCDGDGVPDSCELISGTGLDCNSNGTLDSCDIGSGVSADCNGNTIPDSCDIVAGAADCNGNGSIDSCELIAGTASDCNGNSVPDSCDIAGGVADCDGDGIPDSCELVSGTGQDCNSNGTLDNCDISAGTSLDCNGNGIPDSCDLVTGTSDCNGNSVPDSCDLVAGAADCNGNGTIDSCDISSGSALDCNGNSIPDLCDIATGTAADCNGNSVPDSCDISAGTEADTNGNGIPDVCEVVLFIRGDGNADAVVDISDVVFMLSFLFQGGLDSTCSDSIDCNDDGMRDITDPVQLLSYLFDSGVTLPAPSPGCGDDPTADAIDCQAYAPCP